MSGLEKMSLLVLALDRVAKHGQYYLFEGIDTPEMIQAISMIKNAVESIENWEKIVDEEDQWTKQDFSLIGTSYQKAENVIDEDERKMLVLDIMLILQRIHLSAREAEVISKNAMEKIK